MSNKTIFISHSSEDRELVSRFVSDILQMGLGAKETDIYCTSVDGMNVRSGDDFKKWIHEKITSASMIIQLITTNYKKSEICLNEMGASWALNSTVVPFIIDPVRFDNVGFIHNTTHLLRLNNEQDLLKFRHDHFSNFGADLGEFVDCAKRFLDFFSSSHLTFHSIKFDDRLYEKYFGKFLNPDIDHNKLMLQAQPTLADCRVLFKDGLAMHVFNSYSVMYKRLIMIGESWDKLHSKDFFDYRSTDYNQLIDGKSNLPGGMSWPEVLNNLNQGIIFHSLYFKQYGHEFGVSMAPWVYINDRWVFFPKLWRVMKTIDKLKNEKSFQRIIRLLRRFVFTNDDGTEELEAEFTMQFLISEMGIRNKKK